jgi:hypothetical protein
MVMPENTRFVGDIATHFNVTQPYVMDVFKVAEAFGSMVWIQVIIYAFILAVVSSIICVYFIYGGSHMSRPDLLIVFFVLLMIFAAIYAVIGYMIGLSMINQANPEHAIYMEYANVVLRKGML